MIKIVDKIKILLITMVFIILFSHTASALPPASDVTAGYDYNVYDESVPAPAGYTSFVKITGESLGLEEPLSAPSDIFYDNGETIYVLDSGNSRIVALDKDFKVKEVLSEFEDRESLPLDFTGAEGLTVSAKGTMYIADTLNERVLIINSDRSLRQIITRPESAMEADGLPFDVSKIVLDKDGRIFVIAKSSNLGAFVFSDSGEFERFFGSNPVVKTGEVLTKYFLRRFMTNEQLSAMIQATPITLSNFYIDKEGFVYTLKIEIGHSAVKPGMVRKLNFLGNDVLKPDITFGDLEWDRKSKDKTVITSFSDIAVDSSGFLNLLDRGRGKVFQYSEEGQLIAVFGAYGDQFGCFSEPTSLESVGDNVYVTDAGKNCIYGFSPTAYAQQYRSAVLRLKMYDFENSLHDWERLLAYNTNNSQAYYGMGRAYDMQGEYKTAMNYFKLAGDRTAYSNSFREYRNITVKGYFLPILAVLALVFAALKIFISKEKKKKAVPAAGAYGKTESKYALPLFTLFHPMDGFYQVKTRKIGSMKVSILLILSFFFVSALSFFGTGYIFNMNRISDYNVFYSLLQSVGLTALFIAANWSVCTLLNGNGSLKEITVVTSYSLLPFLLSSLINVILSNLLAQPEAAFLSIVSIIGILWSVMLLLCGLYCVHEYNMTQTIISVIVTVIGMAVIILLIVMFFSLMQQCSDFIKSIVTEALSKR